MATTPTRPLGHSAVCGALGAYDHHRVRRMRSAFGGDLKRAHRDRDSILYLRGPAVRWRGAGDRGVAWPDAAKTTAVQPRSWSAAARDLGAGGLVVAGQRRFVHTSVSGIGPLYWLEAGGATYFSSRIETLVAATDSPLSPDWSAWCEIIALGHPCGARTPFEEVRRLHPMSRLEHLPGRGARVTVEPWPWAQDGAGPADAVDRIVEELRYSIAALPEDARLIPLSGGWDSRLLACLVAERGLDVSAYTINGGTRHDQEERYATAVAAELGIPHEVVAPDLRLRRDFAEAVALQEYQCLPHVPMARIARHLRQRRGAIVDGLAGDVLIKAIFITDEMLAAPRDQAVEMLWHRLCAAQPGLLVFRPDVWDAMASESLGVYRREVERFRDHPSGLSLGHFWTRTRRNISSSPVKMFGAANPVAMPFIAHPVVLAALAPPLESKLDGRLYGQVFARVNAAVGSIPSTNGDEPPERTDLPVEMSGGAARRWYLERLAASPLRPLFSPELAEAVDGGAPWKLRPYLRSKSKRSLYGILTFGLWADAYRDRLRPLDVTALEG